MAQSISPPERVGHPFYTYDMIRGIPAGFAATLSRMKEFNVAERPSSVVGTGNGTAFYSAWAGVQLLEGTGIPYSAIQAMELANYASLNQRSLVVGVSHSGITKNTMDALKSARERGAKTVGLTHFADRPISQVADQCVVIGDGPDKSRCHTKTYVDSAAAVASLSLKVAGLYGFDTKEREASLESLGGTMSDVVRKSESGARSFVDECFGFGKVFVAGAGPNLVTAKEVALKIKESCYLPAEGIELEELCHGSWVSMDGSTLLVVVAPTGPSVGRAADLIRAARMVGAKTLAVSDQTLGAEFELRVPEGREDLSPFFTVIPLYFVAYFLSVKLGYNPDYIRYLTPIYWAARQIVFPSGTH